MAERAPHGPPRAASSKLWAIVKREYLERVRTRWFLIGTVLGPLFFAAIIFIPIALARHGATTAQAQTPGAIILDATGAGLGDHVARALEVDRRDGIGPPEVRIVLPRGLAAAESAASARVLDHFANGYLVLDSATMGGARPKFATRPGGPGSTGEASRLSSAVRTGLIALRLERRGLAAADVDSITAVVPRVQVARLTPAGGAGAGDAKVVLATFIAFFLYLSIVLYGQSMLSGVIEEKLSRVAEVVVSSVRPETLLAGKVLGVSAVGLTQQLIWVGGSVLFVTLRKALAEAGVAPGGDVITATVMTAVAAIPAWWVAVVVLFFLLGFVFFGSLYATVGSIVTSEIEARQAAQPVILLLLTTAIFIQPVVTAPNGTLPRVMSLLPFASPILMPLRMAIVDVPAAEVVASMVILALSCGGAVWLAARVYRVGLLLYGKQPTFRELGRWVLG